jgi:hypothetical protein
VPELGLSCMEVISYLSPLCERGLASLSSRISEHFITRSFLAGMESYEMLAQYTMTTDKLQESFLKPLLCVLHNTQEDIV